MPTSNKKIKKGKKRPVQKKSLSRDATEQDEPDLEAPNYYWEQFIDLVPERDRIKESMRIERLNRFSIESQESNPYIYTLEEMRRARLPVEVVDVLESYVTVTPFPFTDEELEAMRLRRLEEERLEEEKKKAELEAKKAKKKAKAEKAKKKASKKEGEETEGEKDLQGESKEFAEVKDKDDEAISEGVLSPVKGGSPRRRSSISKRDMDTLSTLAHKLARVLTGQADTKLSGLKDRRPSVRRESQGTIPESAIAESPATSPVPEESNAYPQIMEALKEFVAQQSISIKYLPDLEQKSMLLLKGKSISDVGASESRPDIPEAELRELEEELNIIEEAESSHKDFDTGLIARLKRYRQDMVRDYAQLCCAFDVLQTLNEWMRETAASNDLTKAPIVTLIFLWACRMFMQYLDKIMNTSSYDALHPISVTHMHVYSALGGASQSGIGYKLTQYLIDNRIMSDIQYDWNYFAALTIGSRLSELQDEAENTSDLYAAISQALEPIIDVLSTKVEDITMYGKSLEGEHITTPGDERRRRRSTPTNATGVPRPRLPLNSLRCYATKFVNLVTQRVSRDLMFACRHKSSEESLYHGVPLTEAMSLNLLWELNAAVQKIH